MIVVVYVFILFNYRARIFRAQGDITMAIVNYTQAIKLDKNDYESFFQRAEMYEKVFQLFNFTFHLKTLKY